MAKYILNQKVLFETELFGKHYVWLQDPEGTVFLAKLVPDTGVSVDGQTGQVTEIHQGYKVVF